MRKLKDMFRAVFGKRARPGGRLREEVLQSGSPARDSYVYQKGDVIGGKYEVHRILGKGGFGVVYLVFNRETSEVSALKTFRDELLADLAAREAFRREAINWLKLEDHPCIVAAKWIAEISGRLFVEMEYMSPDSQGRTSLGDHLVNAREPLPTTAILKWAIQFCLGACRT